MLDEPTEYNNNKIQRLLKANPELVTAIKILKAQEPLQEKTLVEKTRELAVRLERQMFSFIPGVTGLTSYRNFLILDLSRQL
ncbi:unnamed protein product [Thelazia callipaeda]|uniref:Fic_N domain-containing protein n=1 Tax=Thelazia callipaeda TaxID=103827 RepID=A0A0N5D908_THECL|nr:unnamed protein product [Thelazia callipaeda]